MRPLRSEKVTHGTTASAARALWMAGGMKREDFGKPIIAVANSFTEFVPGHVHLQQVGRLVCDAIWKAGGVAREFNTIAIDDGIAMGHDGMLYSLPSREIVADSIEYMANAHCVDALICISNCDKITPGMLMAGLRLNLPVVFVSGGPMEAGRLPLKKPVKRFDPVDTYIAAFNKNHMDVDLDELEQYACPTCGSCSGMFTANSMNCLAEALGLALPGNGSLLATHADRKILFEQAAATIVELANRYYEQEDESVLPRNIATFAAFENAMKVDIAMGGSTNTILHLLALAQEGDVDFTIADIDRLSRIVPHLCKVSPSTPDYYMEDAHRAGGIMGILGELDRGGYIDTTVATIAGDDLGAVLEKWDCIRSQDEDVNYFYRAAPGGRRTVEPYCQSERWREMDLDRSSGCIRNIENAYSSEGGLAVLFGNISENGCIVKTAAVPEPMRHFTGTARVFDQQDTALHAIDNGEIVAGTIIVIRYEGPKGGPGMQEMLKPTMSLIAQGLADSCAMMTDGRYSGASAGLSIGHISPEAANHGAIALIQDGDQIEIDIPNRSIRLLIDDSALTTRRAEMDSRTDGWQPQGERTRNVTKALKAYAAFAASADRGGYRDI